MKKINLSYLKHKTLPTKDIKVVLNDEEQIITIKPVNGRGLTSLGLISDTDLDKNAKMCLIALIYGLDISQEEAELFMNNETLAADIVAADILKLTAEYQAEINKARSEVKKNSKNKTTK